MPRKEYYVRKDERKKLAAHWGQRKLFLSELYFLTKYAGLSKNVIYAGAAPGKHTKYLATLFPEHKFILVDPSPFHIEENE